MMWEALSADPVTGLTCALVLAVATAPAMALGASVQPLTKITPSVKITVISNTGLDDISCRKCEKETSIKRPTFFVGRSKKRTGLPG